MGSLALRCLRGFADARTDTENERTALHDDDDDNKEDEDEEAAVTATATATALALVAGLKDDASLVANDMLENREMRCQRIGAHTSGKDRKHQEQRWSRWW